MLPLLLPLPPALFPLPHLPQESYLSDLYSFYVKHLSDEASAVDWK